MEPKGIIMNKLKLNYIVDFLMFISFLITGVSGIVASVFVPGGHPQAGKQLFLGISRHVWMDVHGFAGYTFIILVFVHLILHWNWISQMTKNLFKSNQNKAE